MAGCLFNRSAAGIITRQLTFTSWALQFDATRLRRSTPLWLIESWRLPSVLETSTRDGCMIRPYQDADLEQLLSAWAAASALAHPFLSEEFVAQERVNIPTLYLPNAETWVCDRDGSVVGFISLLGNEVGALFVHPEYHKRGIGRGLMDKAAELRGNLEVEVFAANEIGRSFYARYGFKTLEHKRHQPTGQEMLRLRFTVDPPRGA